MIDQLLEGGVAIFTLNRPARRNALSPALVADLIAAIQHAGDDPAVKAVVLTGAAPGFCAGSDLTALAAMGSSERGQFEADSGRLGRMLGELPKPVLAAVHGFAIGGGLTLAAACDIVVTHPSSRWSLPEVPIGLFPAWGLGAVEIRVGTTVARRLAWGIEAVSGEEAVRLGLADHLEASDVLGVTIGLARRLAAIPMAQVTAVKMVFPASSRHEAADALANRLFLAMCESALAQETFRKFQLKD